jgi:hypothetical protein
MTEAGFQAEVNRLISQHRRLVWFHLTRPQRLGKGLPDLIVAGPNGVIWRELKVPPGTLTPEQVQWKWTLLASGQDWAVWLPADLDSGRITRELEQIDRKA